MRSAGAVGLHRLLQLAQQPRRLRFDLVGCEGLLTPRPREKQIRQAGVGADHKLHRAVAIHAVFVFIDGDGIRPALVVPRDTSVVIKMADGSRQDVEHPLLSELLRHLSHRRSVKAVVMVIVPDGGFNGVLTAHIGAEGRAVNVQLPLFPRVIGGIGIDRQIPELFCFVFCRVLDAVADRVHVAGFQIGELIIEDRHGRGGQQQRPRFRLAERQLLHAHQNILPHGVFIAVMENFLRGLALQPVPVFVLLPRELVHEGVFQFFVHTHLASCL